MSSLLICSSFVILVDISVCVMSWNFNGPNLVSFVRLSPAFSQLEGIDTALCLQKLLLSKGDVSWSIHDLGLQVQHWPTWRDHQWWGDIPQSQWNCRPNQVGRPTAIQSPSLSWQNKEEKY